VADAQYHASAGVVERALRLDADWVLVTCAAYLHPDVLILCRRAGRRTAVVFTESPYDDVQQAKVAPLFDVCFTNERASLATLREANANTHYLPAAYDAAHHGTQATSTNGVPAHDVVFVGTGFASRMALLSRVDWTGIDLGLYGVWGDLPPRHPLAPSLRPGLVGNQRTGALYRAAKVGLNLYRDPGWCDGVRVAAESLNPRAYELAADGVPTISHPRAEVGEKFDGGVATFRTALELEQRIRDFVAHPSQAARLGASLPGCVRDDTYGHRAAQLAAHLQRS
jgi:hypothetical protein